MIDFHSHILPNMDDGSINLETSIKLLECLEKQGIDTLCLTSHFYPFEEDIDKFLQRRNLSYKTLKENYKGSIKLLLGAEVYYYRGISNSEDIDKLCLEGTDYLLVELPWGSKIEFTELYSLNNKLSVVLAHIERYRDIYSIKEFKELSNRGIGLQVNTEVFNSSDFKLIKDLFEEGCINFIGSDTHNLDTRIPMFDTFKSYIINKYSLEYYNNYVNKAIKVFLSRKK